MDNRQIEIRRKKAPYTNLPNQLIWDSSLRPQTRWVLIAMLSLPDDWDYSIRGLSVKTGLSKDTVAKMMAELEKAGYLKRKRQAHGNGGRFGRIAYILTDVAFDFSEDSCFPDEEAPCPNSPYTALPYTENSPQQNTILQTNQQEPPIIPQRGRRAKGPKKPKAAPDWKPDRFAAFWDYYPRGESKQAAIRAWDNLKPDDDLLAVMGRALEIQKASKMWQDGIGIPYASTWLNQRRWTEVDLSAGTGGPPEGPQPLRGEGVRYL